MRHCWISFRGSEHGYARGRNEAHTYETEMSVGDFLGEDPTCIILLERISTTPKESGTWRHFRPYFLSPDII